MINEEIKIEQGYKQTEVGIIPEDWEVKDLGSIGEVQMCKRIFSYQTKRSGSIPFYKIGTFGKDADTFISEDLYKSYRKKYSYPNKGDILISASGTIGRTIVFDGSPSYFQDSNIVWIENNEKLILNNYLYYILKVVKYESEGSTIQRLYNSIIKKAKFPLPPTKDEQSAIATALSDMDNLIESLEKLIEKKRNMKQGAMQELLKPKDDWEQVTLDDLIDVNRGGSPRPIQDYITSSPNGINWIKIGDTNPINKYITNSKEKIIPEGVQYSRKVNVGDFLLSNSMSFGRPYILKIDGCIHDGWLVLQNYQKSFDKEFLYYTLMSKYVFNQYLAKASGTGVLNLNKELVKTIKLNKPKNLTEQTRIAEILSDMDSEIEKLEVQLSKYKMIKTGMMQDLLTGKKRLV